MRFKLDENLPQALAQDLSGAGHDAVTCADEGLGGVRDPIVAHHAQEEGRVLITFDLDFSDIRRYAPGTHPGIIVLRLRRQDIVSCSSALSRLLGSVAEDDIRRNLIIVEESRVRVRRP